MSTNSRIGKNVSYISSLTVAPLRMASQDISNWVTAYNSAVNTYNPRRGPLYLLYEIIRQDGKIITILQKRKVSITNKNFVFYTEGKKGETNKRIQDEIINTTWFDEMLEYLEEEDFWGHTALEIVPGLEYPIGGIVKIPPANIVPERGELLKNHSDLSGIPYRGDKADPFFKKYFFEFGKTKNLGLFFPMAQYVIYKRGGFGDWAQFAELFGMPFRVGKYNPFDDNTRKKLLEGLKEMGGAGYAVIPEGTSIEFPNSNYGSGQSGIFKDLIQACNDEMAQMGLGGTMTTDKGSSHAQSKTHQEGENSITTSRLKKIIKFLNGPFRTRLAEHFGYAEAANGMFKVEDEEVISLKDRIKIDVEVAKQVHIPPDYWHDRYNVPAPEGGAKIKEPAQPDPAESEKPKPQKKKAKLSVTLSNYYKEHSCPRCAASGDVILSGSEGSDLKPSSDAEIERLARLIFEKKLKSGSIDKKLLKQTAKKLMQGVSKGFTIKNEAFLEIMHENVFLFSAFKTHQQLKEASSLLLDTEGNVKPFDTFKNDIRALDRTYNVLHLDTEYNLAIASGQMASKWKGFENLPEEFKNWIYNTAGDDRVRELHALLNGKVFRIGDPKTDNLFPPNGFKCRCDGDATEQDINSENVKVQLDGMFNNNVGKTGIVFPESHPYFNTSKNEAAKIKDFVKSIPS